jgi:hypothetical protein
VPDDTGARFQLHGIHGLSGTIVCRRIVVAGVTPCDDRAVPET